MLNTEKTTKATKHSKRGGTATTRNVAPIIIATLKVSGFSEIDKLSPEQLKKVNILLEQLREVQTQRPDGKFKLAITSTQLRKGAHFLDAARLLAEGIDYGGAEIGGNWSFGITEYMAYTISVISASDFFANLEPAERRCFSHFLCSIYNMLTVLYLIDEDCIKESDGLEAQEEFWTTLTLAS